MAKNNYTIDFFSKYDPNDYLPPVPFNAPEGSILDSNGMIPERTKSVMGTYDRQMDNYNEMLQKGFENWPFETVVDKDSLTWLSKEELNNICRSKIGEIGDYLACTYHNEPPLDEFKKDNIPDAGSHTYVLGSLPISLWDVLSQHEKDHHAVTSAKQSMAFDAFHHEDPNLLTKQQETLMEGILGLDSINRFIDRTNWLEEDGQGGYSINNKLNHEPSIRKSLLDYLIEMENLNEQ